jgi:hypothetical protein
VVSEDLTAPQKRKRDVPLSQHIALFGSHVQTCTQA